MRTTNGPVLLDFERTFAGPAECDLVSIAVKIATTGTATALDHAAFRDEYGMDVVQREGVRPSGWGP